MAVMTQSAPADLIEATDAAKEYSIPYTRIRSWWQRKKIVSYRRGDGRVLVSRADIERMTRIEPSES